MAGFGDEVKTTETMNKLKEELTQSGERVNITVSNIIESTIANNLNGLSDMYNNEPGFWVEDSAYLKFKLNNGVLLDRFTNKQITISNTNAKQLLCKLEPTETSCSIMGGARKTKRRNNKRKNNKSKSRRVQKRKNNKSKRRKM
jgi:hypothetical protein